MARIGFLLSTVNEKSRQLSPAARKGRFSVNPRVSPVLATELLALPTNSVSDHITGRTYERQICPNASRFLVDKGRIDIGLALFHEHLLASDARGHP